VTPKDSLAGVALKYGITLANLRRANQLWTSDSIHRRSVLYIPIEVASRAQEYLQETEPTPATSEEATNAFGSAHSSMSSFDGDNSDVGGLTKTSINVVRVPANQLTYFPPSSTKNLESGSNRHSLDNPSPTLGPRISPTSSSKYDPTLPNNSLTSILTALPIAASMRDELFTRLSFDSVSSSYSDTSHGSPNHNGHELGEVRKTNNNRGRKDKLIVSLSIEGDAEDISMPTPKGRPRNNSLPPSPITATRQSSCAPGPLPKSSHVRSISSCSPPQFYVSQPHETFVRTSQPEPSAAMEFPIKRSSTLGSASRKKIQATFGVERQPGFGKDRKGVKDIDLNSLAPRIKLQDPQP
jgi:LysM repeat protein